MIEKWHFKKKFDIPKHLLVAASAWISKIVVASLQLLCVRLLTSTLGVENYAAFAVLTSLSGWFLLVDFGIGSSLQNQISYHRTKGEKFNGVVSILSFLSLVLLCAWSGIALLLASRISSSLLSGFPKISVSNKESLVCWTSIACLLVTFGSVFYKILYAEMRGYWANIVPAFAAIVSYVGILIISNSAIENKLLASLVVFIAPNGILSVTLLACSALKSGVKIEPGDLAKVFSVFRKGFGFFAFSLISALVLQVDYIVMSQYVGAKEIAAYNLATKIFGLAYFIFSATLQSLWPVFSEAISAGRWSYIEKSTRQHIAFGLVAILFGTVCLVFLMPLFSNILSPKEKIDVGVGLVVLLGVYFAIRVWTDTYALILQSGNFMSPFMIYVPVQACVCIGMQTYLAPRYGAIGVIGALIISFIFTVFWGLPLAVSKLKKQGLNND